MIISERIEQKYHCLLQVFCPKPKSAVGTFDSLTDNPPGRILKIVLSMAVGWPLYLVINVTGRDDYERLASHFDPFSPMFRDSHRLKVIVSDLGKKNQVCTVIIHYSSKQYDRTGTSSEQRNIR